jgi:hypothetical protein
VLQSRSGKVFAVAPQLFVAQLSVTADRSSGDPADGPPFAQAVLDCSNLHVVPVLDEVAEDATMVAQVTVHVGRTFPGANGGQMRRLQSSSLPLVHGVVRDAVQADLAVGPVLHAGPFNAIVKVHSFLGTPQLHETWRHACAA